MGKFLMAWLMWGMGFTPFDQSTSFRQNWNLAGFCRMLLFPSRVRYSAAAVCVKHFAIVSFRSRLSYTCLCTSCTCAVTMLNLML